MGAVDRFVGAAYRCACLASMCAAPPMPDPPRFVHENATRPAKNIPPPLSRLLTQAVGMAVAIKLPCHAVFADVGPRQHYVAFVANDPSLLPKSQSSGLADAVSALSQRSWDGPQKRTPRSARVPSPAQPAFFS